MMKRLLKRLLIPTLSFLVISEGNNFDTTNTLAPKTEVSQPKSLKNRWEELALKYDFYTSLEKRVRASEKFLPFVLSQLSFQISLSENQVTAIYTAGDYILKAANVDNISDHLDFIIFVNSNINLKKTIEVYSTNILDSKDPSYDSLNTIHIRILPISNKRAVEIAEAYYLGCLIKGEHPWEKKPNPQLLNELIQSLFEKIQNSGGNTLVAMTQLVPINILLKEEMTPSAIESFEHRGISSREHKKLIEKIYPDLDIFKELEREKSI